MELGLLSFAEIFPDPLNGNALQSPLQRLRNLLEEIELADQVGLDFYGLGEHHRQDFVASAPVTILAAAAARTKTIRLSTAVTVLSSEDPVRVYEQFATLDLLSNGRAEIMAGRGSFVESFPLFGFDLKNYEELFAEKLELLVAIRKGGRILWPGTTHTKPIPGLEIFPKPIQDPLPLWVAVGGTPQSVARAGYLGLPVMLAVAGQPQHFVPLVDLYRQAGEEGGHDPKTLRVGISSHGVIAGDAKQAADVAFPALHQTMIQFSKERGRPMPTRGLFDAGISAQGAYFIGDPQQVIDKILLQHEWFKHDRFGIQISVGTLPHDKVMKTIELYGTVVAPAIRKAILS